MDNFDLNSSINTADDEYKVTAPQIASMYDSSIIIKRWAANVVDAIVIVVMLVLSFYALDGEKSGILRVISSCVPILSIVLILSYYLIIEGITGCTLGKLMFRIRVVGKDFNPPGIIKAFIRTIIKLFEINPFLAGGLPAGIIALVSKRKQRLGDMAASTYVVEINDIPDSNKELDLNNAKRVLISVFIVLSVAVLSYGILGMFGQIKNSDIYNDFTKDGILYTKDGKYQVTLPSGWSQNKSEQNQNPDANLIACRLLKAMFFTVITEEKSSFTEEVDFSIFMQVAKSNIVNMFHGSQIVRTEEVLINGYAATQLEIKFKEDKEKIFALVTLVETPEGYHQLMAIMPEKYIEKDGKGDLYQITGSFKETSK